MIQSLSIVVPAKKCINSCPFCVSGMSESPYPNYMDAGLPFYDLYLKDYLSRLEDAHDRGVNTLMLTGNAEPQQNKGFLTTFGMLMMLMKRPFRDIEMQTTGRGIDRNYLRFLRNHVGVNLISLSVSSFDELLNASIICGQSASIGIRQLAAEVKEYGFTLRLSINLTDYFDDMPPSVIYQIAKEQFGADQITFRVLYADGDSPQANWVRGHAAREGLANELHSYAVSNGRFLEKLAYGAGRYSVNGMSVVVDRDCMSTEGKEDLKYFILQPNCKLYSKWDDPASLVF